MRKNLLLSVIIKLDCFILVLFFKSRCHLSDSSCFHGLHRHVRPKKKIVSFNKKYLMNTYHVLPPLVAQLVKNLPAMGETWVRSLGWKAPLEKGKATHSSILAWRIPWSVCISMGS